MINTLNQHIHPYTTVRVSEDNQTVRDLAQRHGGERCSCGFYDFLNAEAAHTFVMAVDSWTGGTIYAEVVEVPPEMR